MDNSISVVYYTANKEDENFEKKIQRKLLDVIGDLPLISVSQKPIKNFGKNICVGKQPWCDATAHRQLLIGLQEAKTKFVLAAESDCLYPPEYFTFVPPTVDNVYRYNNVWILYSWVGVGTRGLFWKKCLCEGAQMCGREHWIKNIEWALRRLKGYEKKRPHYVFYNGLKTEYSWGSESPVISCKTENGLRKYADVHRKNSVHATELPYWGSSTKLKKELFK